MSDWVTVGTFMYTHQAAMLQARLESEGIDCSLKDNNTADANPLYSVAIGGVKVQVIGEDEEKAKSIIKGMENGNDELELIKEETNTQTNETLPNNVSEVICPYCDSTEVHRDKTPHWVSLFAVILLGIPFVFFGKRKYHCFECGHDFRLEKKVKQ
jgi:hypothetical protein